MSPIIKILIGVCSVIMIVLIVVLFMILGGDGAGKLSPEEAGIEDTADIAKDNDVLPDDEQSGEQENTDEEDTDAGVTEEELYEIKDEDWQDLYRSILAECENEAADVNGPVYGYLVYDVDKDDIPELIVEYGQHEASRHAVLYKYEDDKGAAVLIGDFGMEHAAFYTDPDHQGIVKCFKNANEQSLYRISVEGGMVTQDRIITEYLGRNRQSFSEVTEFVPGARYIETSDPSDDSALTGYRDQTDGTD